MRYASQAGVTYEWRALRHTSGPWDSRIKRMRRMDPKPFEPNNDVLGVYNDLNELIFLLISIGFKIIQFGPEALAWMLTSRH